jgi:hypothetical protein
MKCGLCSTVGITQTGCGYSCNSKSLWDCEKVAHCGETTRKYCTKYRQYLNGDSEDTGPEDKEEPIGNLLTFEVTADTIAEGRKFEERVGGKSLKSVVEGFIDKILSREYQNVQITIEPAIGAVIIPKGR